MSKKESNASARLETHPPPPSLEKRRGVIALPSLFEREGPGVSFLSKLLLP
jgi:hypothetical protein